MTSQLEKEKQIERLLKKKSPIATESKPRVLSTNADIRDGYIEKARYNALAADLKHLQSVFSFYQAIIQNMSSGLISLDLKGYVTFFNKTAAKALKYKPEDLMEKPIDALCGDDYPSKELLHRVIAKRETLEGKELRLINGEGIYIRVGFSSMPLHDENNNHEGMIIVFRDLTEILEMRQQVERMERLATLGELSAGIAHEIRNPLAGVKASAQVLQESFEGSDFRSELVDRIVREIDRSNELLKEFFKFAKPSKPHRSFYDVEIIIDGVYLLLAPRFKKKKIIFQKSFSENTEETYIDENQIEQIFLNLFLNAIDAMEEGGLLKVQTKSSKMVVNYIKDGKTIKENNPAVEILIEDTGSGILPEMLEKIFNPFYTTKSDGLGLGLSISNRLINENGGKMEVESEPGKGSIFRLLLPIRKDQN